MELPVDRFWGLDHGVDIGRLAQLGQLKLTKAAYAYHNPRLSDRLLAPASQLRISPVCHTPCWRLQTSVGDSVVRRHEPVKSLLCGGSARADARPGLQKAHLEVMLPWLTP
jgi:hypothetical protein